MRLLGRLGYSLNTWSLHIYLAIDSAFFIHDIWPLRQISLLEGSTWTTIRVKSRIRGHFR